MAFINEQNLTTPRILKIDPFDARFPYLLHWQFHGHMQPVRSEIRIMNLETGGEVATLNNPTLASEYTIHPSVWGTTMPNNHPWPQHVHARGNGHWYTVEVRVIFDFGNGDIRQSPWSNRVQFLTLTRPNLQILSVTENMEVHNQTVEFAATYSQAQNEPLRSFGFSLLDENMRLLEQYPNQPAPTMWEGVPGGPNHNNGWGNNFLKLTQTIGRFDKNRGYVVKLDVETVNGMRWHQHQWFVSHYLEPTTDGVINVSPLSEEGFIRTTARLEQVRGTNAMAMLESFPWKNLINSEEDAQKGAEDRKKKMELATRTVNEEEHIRFLPVDKPEWVVIPGGQKVIVRRVTFGAVMVFHGQLIGGRCKSGDVIMVLQTPETEDETPTNTFTFYHYFNNGRRRIVCIKDNHSGHKAMYTSNTVTMPENHAWHLNMKFDWQRMSLRLHNVGQEVPV